MASAASSPALHLDVGSAAARAQQAACSEPSPRGRLPALARWVRGPGGAERACGHAGATPGARGGGRRRAGLGSADGGLRSGTRELRAGRAAGDGAVRPRRPKGRVGWGPAGHRAQGGLEVLTAAPRPKMAPLPRPRAPPPLGARPRGPRAPGRGML